MLKQAVFAPVKGQIDTGHLESKIAGLCASFENACMLWEHSYLQQCFPRVTCLRGALRPV